MESKVELAVALFAALLEQPAELERASLALRRPGGFLRGPLGRRALERVYSSSELQSYATCPFQHFVRYLLGARRPDDLARTGLDALRQGAVVHGALERIYSEGVAPQEALDEAFAGHPRELDIGMEEDAFRRRAQASIAAFVGEDDPTFCRQTSLTPHAFELGFGPREAAGALEIDAPGLGGAIRLRGKIDRVDCAAPRPGSEEEEGETRRARGFVTDYKIGAREVDGNYLNAMHSGDELQLPVYLLALERVFGLEPLGASFAALGTRKRTGLVDPAVGPGWGAGLDERRVRMHRVPLRTTLRRSEEHIRRYVAGIAQGLIAPLPKHARDCDRCDARDVCRIDRREARRRARGNRALPIRAPLGPPRSV